MSQLNSSKGFDDRGVDCTENSFRGFENLTANFVYCPNQFFDVCIPQYSRGVIRLVAYILRKTLGWLDANGNPIEQDITITYRDLINKAGVSRGAARQAIDEAIAGGFIVCSRDGFANTHGKHAESSRYTLRWDIGENYVTDPIKFKGFFAAAGNRSPIPNAYFDQIIPHETLAVVKVVSTVLRHTVGYQNQFGGRRSQAPLSYSFIQKAANLAHRPTLSAALDHAIRHGYIRRVSPGNFDPNAGAKSCAAVYAVRWLREPAVEQNSSKTEPEPQFKNRTDSSSKTEPTLRFKNRTDIKTNRNHTLKQQHDAAAFFLLRHEGFDERLAKQLSNKRSALEIEQQISWLPKRNPDTNPLGMLRRAIEENWSEPAAAKQQRNDHAKVAQRNKHEQLSESKQHQIIETDQKKRRRFQSIRRQFLALPDSDRLRLLQETIATTTTEFQRNFIRRKGCDAAVASDVLEYFARLSAK